MCWGRESDRQGGPSRRTDPPAGTFKAVAVGGDHSCALRVDGTAICWGDNEYGQTDVPHGAHAPSRLSVWDRIRLGHLSNRNGTFKAIATGWRHSCAIRSDDAVLCWGYNNPGTGEAQSEFGQARAPGGTFRAISAGAHHSCGLRTDGGVVCWGSEAGLTARLGIKDLTTVSAGSGFTCGVRTDGTINCWAGELFGIGHIPTGTFQAVASGGSHACGLRTGGRIICWGDSPGAIATG